MIRYYAIATAIVLAAFVGFGAWWLHRPTAPLKVGSVNTTMAPHAQATDPGGLGTSGFLAAAPWALSAVPECLRQSESAHGPRAFVLGALPRDAVLVQPGEKLRYGDCRITLEARGVIVHRGPDTLLAPAPVRLYRSAGHLYVVSIIGTHAQLRSYVPSNM